MNARSFLLALVVMGVTPAAAEAACSLRSVTVPGNTVTVSYDPFDAAIADQPIPVTLTGTDCNNRNLFLSIEEDPSYPGILVANTVQLGSPPNRLQLILNDGRSSQGSNGFFNVTINGATLYLTIPRGQRVAPGEYVGTLQLRAAENNGRNTDGVSTLLHFRIVVEASVGLAAASGTALNLGELGPGATSPQPVTFHAYSNTGYALTVSTDFDLRLLLDPQQTQVAVPYVLQFDNRMLTSVPAQLEFSNPGDPGFRTHALNAEVAQMPTVPAGTYRDYITVEISPPTGG